MEKISEFDFEIKYVPGTENVLADALSHMYSGDKPGTVRAPSEYTCHDDGENEQLENLGITMPVLTGLEASAMVLPETGRPETSCEFAKRIRRVKLLVREPAQEGGDGAEGSQPGESPSTPEGNKDSERESSIRNELNNDSPDHIDTPQTEANTVPQTEPNELPEWKDHIRSTRTEITQAIQNPTPVRPGPKTEDDPGLLSYIAIHENFSLEEAVRHRYKEDLFFKAIIEKPRDFKNFTYEEGLLFLQLQDKQVLCLPDVSIGGRSIREIAISHAHLLLAHLGTHKMLDLL
ncbi:hypothetical protein OE88DRAFT_1733321 [Heliocybe sulcata]|uniref:Reverse transcriptase RNase H-like domain-containing protein n=1 Tax=Heliocybe sulcata TaxID=5364 RepID=A0A5C3NAB0_9AGAM|nr:hypothetical protein OE88DRAFT_1733321 [Heliocybe sulcata]